MMTSLQSLADQAFGAMSSGLYQGLLLVIVLELVLRGMPGVNAATRFAVRFVALVLVALLPVALGLIRPGDPSVRIQIAAAAEAAAADAVATPGSDATTDDVGGMDDQSLGEDLAWDLTRETEKATESGASLADLDVAIEGRVAVLEGLNASGDVVLDSGPFRLELAEASASAWESGRWDGERSAEGVVPTAEHPRGGPARPSDEAMAQLPPLALTPVETRHRPSISSPGSEGSEYSGGAVMLPAWLTLLLVGAWGVVAFWRTASLVGQYAALRRLRSRAVPARSEVGGLLEGGRRALGLRRKVEVRTSFEAAVPMVVGLWNPVVVLPKEMEGAPSSDLDRILRHELAHVQRGDVWTNLVQQGLRAVFFFHPGVLWLSRRLTLDREIACDDHALQAVGNRRDYALLLTDFAGRRQSRPWTAAPAAWTRTSQLRERINMILDRKRNASPQLATARWGALSLSAVLLAALGVYAAPRLAIAASADGEGASNLTAEPASQSSGASEARVATTATATTPTVPALATPEAKWKDGVPPASVSVPPVPTTPELRQPRKDSRPVPVTAPAFVPVSHPVPAVVALPPGPPPPSPEPLVAPPALAEPPPPPEPPSSGTRGVIAWNEAPPRVVRSLNLSRTLPADRSKDLERRLNRLERLVEALVEETDELGQTDDPTKLSEDDAKAKAKDKAKAKAKEKIEQIELLLGKEKGESRNEYQLRREASSDLRQGETSAVNEDHEVEFDFGDAHPMVNELEIKTLVRTLTDSRKDIERAAREIAQAAKATAGGSVDQARHEALQAKAHADSIQIQHRILSEHRDVLHQELERIHSQLEDLNRQLAKLEAKRAEVEVERNRVQAERDRVQERRDRVREEREEPLTTDPAGEAAPRPAGDSSRTLY